MQLLETKYDYLDKTGTRVILFNLDLIFCHLQSNHVVNETSSIERVNTLYFKIAANFNQITVVHIQMEMLT